MARARNSRNKATWDGGEAQFDWKAFSEIRRSPEVMELLERVAADFVEDANNYPTPAETKRYGAKVQEGRYTTSAVVFPASPHAKNSNAKHNTLIKLLGKGDRV